MKLYNSLHKKLEEFIPNKKGEVGIYSCGPTVYWFQHIGHMYAYVQWDTLVRFLRFMGNKVTWVANLTDVGHMTSDEDSGEDKMEKGAKREGVSVWEIADKYIAQYKDSLRLLNVQTPDVLCRATEHIDEQIKLNQKIEKNGFTYTTDKGLVFDTSKFTDYCKFAGLNLDKLKKRDDIEEDFGKKLPWDFFLWVKNPKHIMKWPSPWGEGYPGWHIECSAMSTKYLGENFDIHTGGIEHISVHHTNEIAQGFAAFGKQTANYWLHNAWLKGEKGEKMSKSLGNYVTTQDLVKKGYDPISLRYLILTSHYRKGLRFSWQALDSSQKALMSLRDLVSSARDQGERNVLSDEKLEKINKYRADFISALENDLNVPQALAVLWEMLKSNIPGGDKYDLALSFDEVLGLGLDRIVNVKNSIPKNIAVLISKRNRLRGERKFDEADKIREELVKMGYDINDASLPNE